MILFYGFRSYLLVVIPSYDSFYDISVFTFLHTKSCPQSPREPGAAHLSKSHNYDQDINPLSISPSIRF